MRNNVLIDGCAVYITGLATTSIARCKLELSLERLTKSFSTFKTTQRIYILGRQHFLGRWSQQ